jgi:hypothetical protein
MTPETEAMLKQWLTDGTETQRRHAAAVLAGLPPQLPANLPDRPVPGTAVRLGGCCGG